MRQGVEAKREGLGEKMLLYMLPIEIKDRSLVSSI